MPVQTLFFLLGISVLSSTRLYSQSINDTVNYYSTSIYPLLKHTNIYGRVEWALGDVYSDDSQAGGEPGGNDQPQCQLISRYEVTECNYYIQWYWEGNYQTINLCNQAIQSIETMASPTGRYSRKYEIHPFEITNSDLYLPLNIKVIRYADVYLWAAEAAFNLRNTPKALEYINIIRTRARYSGNTGVPADLMTLTIEDIMRERRVELGLEGHRFFDLQRYHKAGYLDIGDAIRASGKPGKANFNDTIHALLPIPVTALGGSLGSIGQNFGYGVDAPYTKKNISLKVRKNSADLQIVLGDYFGCISGEPPAFKLNSFTKRLFSSATIDADGQITAALNPDSTGTGYINGSLTCGCSMSYSFKVDVVDSMPSQLTDAGYTGINVYPNPVNNLIHINGLTSMTEISVYTLSGEKVLGKLVDKPYIQLGVSTLKSGIYFLKMTTREVTFIEKIIRN